MGMGRVSSCTHPQASCRGSAVTPLEEVDDHADANNHEDHGQGPEEPVKIRHLDDGDENHPDEQEADRLPWTVDAVGHSHHPRERDREDHDEYREVKQQLACVIPPTQPGRGQAHCDKLMSEDPYRQFDQDGNP